MHKSAGPGCAPGEPDLQGQEVGWMWLVGCAHPGFQGPCRSREAGDPGSVLSGPRLWPEFGDFPVSKMQILIPASLSCGFDVVVEGRTGHKSFCKL